MSFTLPKNNFQFHNLKKNFQSRKILPLLKKPRSHLFSLNDDNFKVYFRFF